MTYRRVPQGELAQSSAQAGGEREGDESARPALVGIAKYKIWPAFMPCLKAAVSVVPGRSRAILHAFEKYS